MRILVAGVGESEERARAGGCHIREEGPKQRGVGGEERVRVDVEHLLERA